MFWKLAYAQIFNAGAEQLVLEEACVGEAVLVSVCSVFASIFSVLTR